MGETSSRRGQPEEITHTRLYRPSRERGPIADYTVTQAKRTIAEKTDALLQRHSDWNEKRAEKKDLLEELQSIEKTLPPDSMLGKLTGVLSSDTRKKWARAATLHNQIATLDESISNLQKRYDTLRGEIDDVVLGVVKQEGWWRKASTVERYVVQLKIDVRAYKKAVDAAEHRANGILAEKIEDSLSAGSNAEEEGQAQTPPYIQELTLLLQHAYAAGDAFLRTFGEYYSAMTKPPPWYDEVPVGKNVRIALNLVENRELLSIYTPDSIHALEERLGFLSERLAIARKEIDSLLKKIRAEKNRHFHNTKKKLSTHYA